MKSWKIGKPMQYTNFPDFEMVIRGYFASIVLVLLIIIINRFSEIHWKIFRAGKNADLTIHVICTLEKCFFLPGLRQMVWSGISFSNFPKFFSYLHYLLNEIPIKENLHWLMQGSVDWHLRIKFQPRLGFHWVSHTYT